MKKSNSGSSSDFFSTIYFSRLFYMYGFAIPAKDFVKQYLIAEKECLETELTDHADLSKDLGLDSLDIMNMNFCVCSFFGVWLDDAFTDGKIRPVLSEIFKYCEEHRDSDYASAKNAMANLNFSRKNYEPAMAEIEFM